MDSTRMPTATTTAPTQNGVFGRNASARRPAIHGARPPPRKRTKLYEADATGRSTGATDMTAWVTSVLLSPIMAPATITAPMTTPGVSFQTAMTSRSTASSPST